MSSENSHIGGSLGNYCITAEIGSGGFGKVYQGQHTILTERKVAIKQLHSHLGSPHALSYQHLSWLDAVDKWWCC